MIVNALGLRAFCSPDTVRIFYSWPDHFCCPWTICQTLVAKGPKNVQNDEGVEV